MNKEDAKRVIIKSGGKQYLVRQGDTVDVELLSDNNIDAKVEFTEILYAFDGKDHHIGSPALENFKVAGQVVGASAGEKITCLKYKRSHNQRRKWGHRQKYTRVKITQIDSI